MPAGCCIHRRVADCVLTPYPVFIGELVASAVGRPSMVTDGLADYAAAVVRENPYVAQGIEEMRAGVMALR